MRLMKTTRAQDELVARYRHLSRRLADESLSPQDADAIRRELDGVKAELG
jgi:hypothetical protein